MEMHQVRYFLALCEELNFTRAAARCNVAQPSLTRAVKKLEEELGGPLFRRERNLTHLTDLGRLMKPHLESIYTSSQAARSQADDFRGLKRAPLKLGVMCTIGPARLISFFDRLNKDAPNVELSLHESPGEGLVEEMMQGELDIALVGLPEYPERFDARPLFTERYVIAFYKGHRFEAMNAVPLKQLDKEDYLDRTNCEYLDHFDALGIPMPCDVNIRYESEREDWIQAMILAKIGCSVMPESLPVLPGILTRVLIEPDLARDISLVTVAGRRFSPAVKTFVHLAERYDWETAM
ncbi:MAG: LysR family transcriptional regulator [Alphaproteobacteria bacterium]|nr:LysR family transcriptional regulator [Pseudomonadota bacterium]